MGKNGEMTGSCFWWWILGTAQIILLFLQSFGVIAVPWYILFIPSWILLVSWGIAVIIAAVVFLIAALLVINE